MQLNLNIALRQTSNRICLDLLTKAMTKYLKQTFDFLENGLVWGKVQYLVFSYFLILMTKVLFMVEEWAIRRLDYSKYRL